MTGDTAANTAARVRSGRVRARDVLEEHLNRIKTRNCELNALVAVRMDAARDEADRIDRFVTEGGDPGPLAGVPFTVKDVLGTADLPTTCGSRALAGHLTGADAEAVRRVRGAGAVLVGKTNTPEFGFGVHTINQLFGVTAHPDAATTVGGSSGGEAAAVASGMSSFGLGTDFGGSLRWPGQCTGTVGLRSEIGTVPTHGVLPTPVDGHRSLQDDVQVVGPITRSITDARLVLDVLTGAARPTKPRGDLSTVRLRWGPGPGPSRSTEAVGAVAELATSLAALSAEVHEGLPVVVEQAGAVYDELRSGEDHAALAALLAGRSEHVEPRNQHLLEQRTAPDISSARAERDRLVKELDALMGRDTLLALPVSTRLPGPPDVATLEDFDLLRPCRAISLFGLAAVAIPWGRVENRPVSVQLVAPRGAAGLVLEVAEALVNERMRKGAA